MENTRSTIKMMSVSELSTAHDDLSRSYEGLWEQVDNLYKNGATTDHVAACIDRLTEQMSSRIASLHTSTHERMDMFNSKLHERVELLNSQTYSRLESLDTKTNSRLDVSNLKIHDRLDVLSDRLNDIVEKDLSVLSKYERENYTQLRTINTEIESRISFHNDRTSKTIQLLQAEIVAIKKFNDVVFPWLCYTILVLSVTILYKFYN